MPYRCLLSADHANAIHGCSWMTRVDPVSADAIANPSAVLNAIQAPSVDHCTGENGMIWDAMIWGGLVAPTRFFASDHVPRDPRTYAIQPPSADQLGESSKTSSFDIRTGGPPATGVSQMRLPSLPWRL